MLTLGLLMVAIAVVLSFVLGKSVVNAINNIHNQLMEIAAELNPSQRDHVLEILEVMVPYIKN